MRTFGLYWNNSQEELIDKTIASDIHQAQEYFCKRKDLNIHELTSIFYIKEIEYIYNKN